MTILLSGLLGLAAPGSGFADNGGGGGSGKGGGGGNGGGNGNGNGNGNGDDNGGGNGEGKGRSGKGSEDEDDSDVDDEEDRDEARTAVREGKAAPLRELLTIIERKYPGEIVDVRVKRAGTTLTYRVKILDSTGRLVIVSIDAASKQILSTKGL